VWLLWGGGVKVLHFLSGDIWTTIAQAIVIPVNCRGVAGCGLALAARKRIPGWYASYRTLCATRILKIGEPVLHTSTTPLLVSFPTKDDYRWHSRLVDIERGLVGLCSLCERYELASIAVPKLGCGAGGLSWEQVRPLIVAHLSPLALPVWVYV
jgi:O-acetyl-ADP-ribose deacetylase (regulator of RNase III)